MKHRHHLTLIAIITACFALLGCKEQPASTATNSAAVQESFTWKMVTAWPKNYPGLGTSAERVAERIKQMSNGRLTIKVYAGGANSPPA